MVDVCLLGCGGMMPLPDRWLTALLYRYNGRMILIDCGEGTQIPLKQVGWGFKSIDAICFTHYHADHIAGLPGLLLTLGNSGRTEPLYLYGPTGLEQVIDGLTVICPQLPFELRLTELSDNLPSSFEVNGIRVNSLPADHGMPCLPFSLNLERPGRFNKEKAQAAGIPVTLWKHLQSGENVTYDGSVFTPEMVMGEPRKGIKVGYCTDSRPTELQPGFMKDCTLLICEGMYGDESLAQKACEKGHMLFSQAAEIARKSCSAELWLTHYSPSLSAPEDFLSAATDIFENTLAGHDLMKTTLEFED